jgi:hypothetical protein
VLSAENATRTCRQFRGLGVRKTEPRALNSKTLNRMRPEPAVSDPVNARHRGRRNHFAATRGFTDTVHLNDLYWNLTQLHWIPTAIRLKSKAKRASVAAKRLSPKRPARHTHLPVHHEYEDPEPEGLQRIGYPKLEGGVAGVLCGNMMLGKSTTCGLLLHPPKP